LAHHVSIGIASIFGAYVLSFLELFVAFLQAFVFTILSAVFIGTAVHSHDHHHDDSESHKHGADQNGSGHIQGSHAS